MKFYKIKKIYFLIFLFFLVCLFVEFFLTKDKLVFLSVGQGDAVLISVNYENFLVDGGPDWETVKALDRNLPFFNRQIEAIILTHAHHDHFVGLAEIIRRYKVKKLYFYYHDLSDLSYKEFISFLKSQKVEIINVSAGLSLSVGSNCKLNFLWPLTSFNSSDLNDLSLVSKFTCKNISSLLTGDITEAVEKLLITYYNNLEVDVLKASHHGSKYSNSLPFLEKVNPEMIVFTVGKANKYGFPSPESINRAKKLNIKIKSTEEQKDLIFYIK